MMWCLSKTTKELLLDVIIIFFAILICCVPLFLFACLFKRYPVLGRGHQCRFSRASRPSFTAGFSEEHVKVLRAVCLRNDVAQMFWVNLFLNGLFCFFASMFSSVTFPRERVTCLHCATWTISVSQSHISLYFPALPARPALPAGRGVLWAWGLCQSPPSLWQKVLDSGTEIWLVYQYSIGMKYLTHFSVLSATTGVPHYSFRLNILNVQQRKYNLFSKIHVFFTLSLTFIFIDLPFYPSKFEEMHWKFCCS